MHTPGSMRSIFAAATLHAVCILATQAQTFVVTDLSPPEALESFFRGGDPAGAVGSISVQDPNAPFPDARRVYAVRYDRASGTVISLDPSPAYSASYANRGRAGQQVGFGFTSGPNLALLWTGTADSAVVLNSPGVDEAVAYDTDGARQVGSSITPDSAPFSQPWIWEGTAASGRALPPVPGLLGGYAAAIRDGRIIGSGDDEVEFRTGVYWPSPDQPGRLVRPDGFDETFLSDLTGSFGFGDGSGSATAGARHAILFDLDNPAAWIDLHPDDPSYLNSYGAATNGVTGPGSILVGTAAFEDVPGSGETFEHACVWIGGVATGFVDLHSSLPPGYPVSKATGIDDAGNIYGWATDLAGAYIAVRWSPACRADFNADGFLDFFDYLDFVACFEGAGSPGCDADFNADDFVDFFDYDDFVAAFETGC
jgi:hypothetical protein